MFTLTQENRGQCVRKVGDPILVSELDELPDRNGLVEDFESFKPSKPFRPRWAVQSSYKRHFVDRFDDASILVELAWASRDPGAKDCPRSRRELRTRLGLAEASRCNAGVKNTTVTVNTERSQRRSNTHVQDVSEPRSVYISGIGNMPLSDESAGNDLSDSTCSYASDALVSEDACCDALDYASGSDSELAYRVKGTVPAKRNERKLYSEREDDFSPVTNDSESIQNESFDSSVTEQWPYSSRSARGGDGKSGNGKPDSAEKLNLSTISLDYPDQLSILSSRLGNTTYMIRTPSVMAQTLLHYLVSSTLATHQFDDALYLMALYLSVFARPSYTWININDYRLIQRFFSSTPDAFYSTLRLTMLQQCYGNPTFIRHDILYDLCSLYCARRQCREALAYLEGLPHVTGDSLTGTVHACFAYVLYAQWLSDNVRAGESTSIHCNELYQRLALSLGQSRLAGEIRRQLEAAVLRTWKHQKILPTLILRLLALCFASTNVDKMLSILQDFIGVSPTALDVLELRVLCLQLKSRSWDINDSISALISGNNDLEHLVKATLQYVDFARGEPASLVLAVQAFRDFPMIDRLRCIVLCLDSNPFYALAWRVFVDETLGVLGRALASASKSEGAVSSSSSDHALALWTVVDKVFGRTEKLHWHRRFFDAQRTSLFCIAPGARVLVLLMSPFFLTDWGELCQLAELISFGFSGRRPSLVAPRRQYGQSTRFTIPFSAASEKPWMSESTFLILFAFRSLVACVTDLQGQELDESAMCDSEAVAHNTSEVQLVLNSVELELLTEAALQLLPRPSIANTLGASRMHPSDTETAKI